MPIDPCRPALFAILVCALAVTAPFGCVPTPVDEPDDGDDGDASTDDDDDADPLLPPAPIPQLLDDPIGFAAGDTDALALGEIEAVSVGRFVTSTGCALCHSNHDDATAMRDSRDAEIAPFNLWRGTMMANASRDPFWRAVVAAETARVPSAREAIESECMRCHAPLASVLADDEDTTADLSWLAGDLGEGARMTALDGAACTLCHQTLSDNFGTEESFNGGFVLNDDRKIFGPHQNPATGPMQVHVNYTPTYGPHVLEAELCATCHVLETTPLDDDGDALPASFLEQATYLEWRASSFAPTGDEPGAPCQSCHMPTFDDTQDPIETRIARSPPGGDFLIDPREPFGRHLLVGANYVIPAILRDERDTLNPQATDEAFDDVVQLAKRRLSREAAELFVEDVTATDNRVTFAVRIESKVGHKLPTGFPARRLWVQARVVDAAGAVLFESGAFDDEGRILSQAGEILDIEKAGGPIAPHTDLVTRSEEVPIFEQIMADDAGNPTFTILRAAGKAKDNRILPTGVASDAADWPRIAPVAVDGDDSFVAGTDTVHYDVVVGGVPAAVEVTLWYQSLSARFVRELWQADAPEVAAFRTMLERADNRPATVESVRVDL